MPLLPQPDAPLRTARLELLVPTSADLDAIHALHADPRTFAHDSTPVVTDRERMARVLATWLAAREEQGFGYAIVRARIDRPAAQPGSPPTGPRTAGLLGMCGLTRYALGGREVLSAYYRFSPAVWGHGVAREAMVAVLAQADAALAGAESVVITDRGNAPALALAEHLGYRATLDPAPDGPHQVVLSRPIGEGRTR